MSVQSHALLPLPFPALRDWITAAPIWAERGRIEADGTLHVTFGVGQMQLSAAGAQSSLVLECADAAGLQVLRDFITEEASEAGVFPQWQERHRKGRPANLCVAQVARVELISPAFRRLWLQGKSLGRLLSGGLHFRLLLGPHGADWPHRDEAGLTVWPGGLSAWHRPVYTVRSIDGEGPDTLLAVDIFLHDGGQVTEWSRTLQPGDEVALMGPSGGDVPQGAGGKTPWFGLFGDETALPAIARITAALPALARGVVVLRVPAPADIQPLPLPEGMGLTWLFRQEDDRAETLVDALRATALPARDRFVFFAASATEVAAARGTMAEMGLAKAESWAQAYWHAPGAAEPPHDH